MRIAMLLILTSLLYLTGCAGMSKSECLVADWQTIGFEDGANGRNISNIGPRRQDCAKHGVKLNMAAYESGYQNGIQNYCSQVRGRNDALGGYTQLPVCPSNTDYHAGFEQGLEKFCTSDAGFEYGLAGGNYHRTCPTTSEARFTQGYEAGREIYLLQSQLADLDNELQNILAARDSNDHHQDSLKQQLILDRTITTEDRAHILLDIDALRDQDDELKQRKGQLQNQIGDLRDQLASLDGRQ